MHYLIFITNLLLKVSGIFFLNETSVLRHVSGQPQRPYFLSEVWRNCDSVVSSPTVQKPRLEVTGDCRARASRLWGKEFCIHCPFSGTAAGRNYFPLHAIKSQLTRETHYYMWYFGSIYIIDCTKFTFWSENQIICYSSSLGSVF